MGKLIVMICSFVGAWGLTNAFCDKAKEVVFHLGTFGITWSLIAGFCALWLASQKDNK